MTRDNTVITVHVDVDNLINLLQAAADLAKLLLPIFKALPVARTSIIAAGVGAHLGAAVLGQLPVNIQVQQIIGEYIRYKIFYNIIIYQVSHNM